MSSGKQHEMNQNMSESSERTIICQGVGPFLHENSLQAHAYRLIDMFALVGGLEVCESDSRGQIRGSSLGKQAREEKYSSTTYAILSTLSKCLSRDQDQRSIHHEKSRRRFVYNTRWCRGIAWYMARALR